MPRDRQSYLNSSARRPLARQAELISLWQETYMLKLLPYLLNLSGSTRFQRPAGSPARESRRGAASFFCLMLALSTAPAIASNARDNGATTEQPGTAESYDDAEGLASYNWNLIERQRPLLNLPDRLRPNIDLSLSYPMDQFEFPLFQSLYFNKRCDDYLLILMPKTGRRAQLVELVRRGTAMLYADASTGLRLLDKNDVKILRSRDGTEYTFSLFADGEFRCSRVSGARGPALTLSYASDNLLQRITDPSGRTVKLNYQSGRFDSITQTWSANSVSLTRTWTIRESKISVQRAHANYSRPTLLGIAKAVPHNATTPSYTREMVECDRLLARIFGDPGAVAAANGFEPQGLARQYPLYRGDLVGDDGRTLRGHLSYAMHLYGNADGTGNSSIYVPDGFTTHSNEPSPTDAAVLFYYPRLGNLTSVTIAVFHVADFGISYHGGRVRIGNIGGPGGSSALYKHSHIEFYRGNTPLPSASARPSLRIDPASVFGLRTEAASNARY